MSRIASKFYVLLRNTNYEPIARFDSWIDLSYTKVVNGVGSYSFSIRADDNRVDLFDLDGLIEIYRSVPGMGISWYREFQAFHRLDNIDFQENGNQIYLSSGPTLLDFLARTSINYSAATIKSYKLDASETVMKEYVEENCGASATVANGREFDGVLRDFEVEADTGYGIEWEGDRSYENLLDIIKDIGKKSDLDFDVTWDLSSEKFIFQTFLEQRGLDRTSIGLDANTGKNAAGNYPTVFSMGRGNIKSMRWTSDRMSESNVISVLGEGDGATRIVVCRSKPTTNDSPWNRREISRPKTGYISEMETFGDESLEELESKQIISFAPLFQERCMYGLHYGIGDRISVVFKEVIQHKRIIEVSNSVGKAENISLKFSDIIKI